MNYFIKISFVIFFLPFLAQSQIGKSYNKIQKKFGKENISTNNDAIFLEETKKINRNEEITFYYKQNIVKMIVINSLKPITNNRFHKLARKLNSKFKVTNHLQADLHNIYIDSKNNFVNIKEYKTTKKLELIKLIFISDIKLIQDFFDEHNISF